MRSGGSFPVGGAIHANRSGRGRTRDGIGWLWSSVDETGWKSFWCRVIRRRMERSGVIDIGWEGDGGEGRKR